MPEVTIADVRRLLAMLRHDPTSDPMVERLLAMYRRIQAARIAQERRSGHTPT